MLTISMERVTELQRIFENTPRQVPIVVSRAVNRAIVSARTETSRKVCQVYKVKHGDIIKTIRISKANAGRMQAEMRSEDSVLPLSKFGVSTNAKGVRVAVKRGGSKQIKSAFIITSARGGANAFVRTSTKRTPVKGLHGPSVPQMIGNEGVVEGVADKAGEVLNRRLDHEISRLMGG